MIHPHTDRIHPAPFLSILKSYRKGYLRGDVLAGITVAIFAIPQAIACASLAEVPPIYGLYAAMVASIVAALWGSSPYVNTGPSNSASLLTLAALSAYTGSSNYVQIVFFFTLMVGIIRLSMGLLRMGWLIHFVPESAFLGFTVGVGTTIALTPLHHFFGIAKGDYRWFPATIWDKVSRIGESNPHAVAISILTLLIMFGLSKYSKKFPLALLAIVAGTLYALFIAPEGSVVLVQDMVREIKGDGANDPSKLPSLMSPFFEGWVRLVPDLALGALAVAVVGLIEAVSIGQSLAIRHRQHLNFNQELFGQGLSMIACSFFQGIPGSGSFSRSKLMEESGGVTFVANIVFGLATAVALVTIPGLINLIPAASLGGLLIYIGIRLIDPKRIKRLWKTSTMDVGVMLATLFVTIFLKIEYGIFTGIVLAAMLLINKSRLLHLQEILPTPNGSFEEHPYTTDSRHEPSSIVALTVHGDLSYGVAHELLEQLNEIARIQDPEIMVLRIRRIFSIDFSCWNAIFDFAESFQNGGGQLFISDIDDDTRKTIHDAHAHQWIPDDNLFVISDNLMESFQVAMRKAAGEVTNPEKISGRWRDWLDDPVVISHEQVMDIHRFLNGESL
jgi:SulP family sulfate permease